MGWMQHVAKHPERDPVTKGFVAFQTALSDMVVDRLSRKKGDEELMQKTTRGAAGAVVIAILMVGIFRSINL